ncbi:hypothetical protein ABIB25_005376 [Nakamurella sp. UYEF19]|uniref:hypothetical protein n=1 Tax=Nakamurella sp. UYEF19 TaxID=1756392 RepID=UPI003399ADDD
MPMSPNTTPSEARTKAAPPDLRRPTGPAAGDGPPVRAGEDLGAAESERVIRPSFRYFASAVKSRAAPRCGDGFADPLLDSAAMALSSLFVVPNSLRLAKLEPVRGLGLETRGHSRTGLC